jgi:tetratricopeptide (TPR) repeat protein
MSGTYYDLGSHQRPITTTSDEAQAWFDRGLVWTYGFNHEAAIACFENALALDPTCAMANWGIAFALGPNYNNPWAAFSQDELVEAVASAHDQVEQAARNIDIQPVERDLISALSRRYPSPTPADDCAVWDDDYATAMRSVHEAHPDDLDVATLFADALMNRTPWALWDLRTGEPADHASTVEAREVLERALDTPEGQRHPGVLHMYIHLMEMSPHPEAALRAADWLRGVAPDAGHLEHMATHIDVLCGHYQAVVDSNSAAIAADLRYWQLEGAMNVYSLYRAHNYHFKLYGAMLMGQIEPALEAADGLETTVPIEVIAAPGMADLLESFHSMRMHVLIRFGRWDEIIATSLPDDQDLMSMTTAVIRYAKGVAHAASGRVEEAEAERVEFRRGMSRVPESRTLFNNTCQDILAIASEMLDGEIAYRRREFDTAFDHLRRSISLDDGLPYDEPWGWMQPTRHAYGALLLEQGHVTDAEAVYRGDLGFDDSLPRPHQHPDNVWSLHGLHECLELLGRPAEASMVKLRLDLAMARTDVEINASCYCRLTHGIGTPGDRGQD